MAGSGRTIISPANTPEKIQAVRELLLEYGRLRNFDAALGNYSIELKGLPGKYGLPFGCLLLATFQEVPAGCIAYQRLSPQICEMKRLFVHPNFRRKGIAQQLVSALLAHARQAGYKIMRLDSHPSMLAAQALYESFGFYPIERYNENPTPGIRFFELQL